MLINSSPEGNLLMVLKQMVHIFIMVGPLVDGPVDVPRVDVLLMTLKLIVLQ